MFSKITELQEKVVQRIADRPTSAWIEIVVNFEAEGDSGAERTNSIAFAVFQKEDEFSKESICLEFEDEDLLLELREAYGEIENMWTILHLQILPSGQFTFDLDYTSPPRLAGDIKAHRRFENYLENYRPPEL